MNIDLALALFLLLAVLNYRVQGSVLYPPFIFCVMWSLCLAVIRLNILITLFEVTPVHGNTLAIAAVGAASFSLGGLLAGLAPRGLLHVHLHIFPRKQKRSGDLLRSVLVIALLCTLPVVFYQILQLSRAQGGGLMILLQAHQELIEETLNSNRSPAVVVIGYVSLYSILTSLVFATGRKDWKFWIVTVVAFIASILTTGRVALLILISGLSGIHLLQGKQESLRSAVRFLRWPIALFALLFIALIFTNKPTETMVGGMLGIATTVGLGSLVFPLAAFDVVVQNPDDFMVTFTRIFDSPLHLMGALHIAEYTPPPPSDSFIFVPFPTNVYTIYKFYYLELGLVGTLVFLFSFGLLHSLLYLKARQGGRFSTYLFAFSIFPLLMVIFADQYYLYSLYLRAATFGILYFTIGSAPVRRSLTNRPSSVCSQVRC